MRILIILNADADAQAGVVREFDGLIEAHYLFCDAGVDVVVAASGGGSAGEAAGQLGQAPAVMRQPLPTPFDD
jgi:hypothetical protein